MIINSTYHKIDRAVSEKS